jgi:hypothetical protein
MNMSSRTRSTLGTAAAFVFCLALSSFRSQAAQLEVDDSRILEVARGDGYVILAFNGMVLPQAEHGYRVKEPGIAVIHITLKNGVAQYLLSTGIFEQPTVSPTYGVSRLLGIDQNEEIIGFLVVRGSARIHPKSETGGDLEFRSAHYQVELFDRATGRSLASYGLPVPVGKNIPRETPKNIQFKLGRDSFDWYGKTFRWTRVGEQLRIADPKR